MSPLSRNDSVVCCIVDPFCTSRVKCSVATVKAAILLFTRCFAKLAVKHGQGDYLHILKSFIKMLTSAFLVIQVLVTKKKLGGSTITDALDMWESGLKNWIVNPNVIGGAFFGGTLQFSKGGKLQVSKSASLEIKV